MALNQASIQRASIQAIFVPGDVTPLCVPQDLFLPINFCNVSNLQSTSGTYTPSNDTFTIRDFSASDQANFILLVVDQPAVINLASGANAAMVTNMCVQRFFYIGLQTLPSLLSALSFNGAAAGPEVPMTQNVPINWTIYWGMAKIS